MWWYQKLSNGGRHFSVPFQDNQGHWWYQVRPGFAWPVDAIDAVSAKGRRVPFSCSYLAYQHVVPDGEYRNSTLAVNTILDLPAYSARSIDDKRRNAIRKGFRSCEVIAVNAVDDKWLAGVTKAWNDLVDRTGWKTHRDAATVAESLKRLIECPAATFLLAVERASGRVAGFLITRILGETAYVDTIASNTELLKSNPNDILMYTFIRNAQRLPGIRKVHYAIRSNVTHLESFKTSLGFEPHPFPAMLWARPGLGTVLRLLNPRCYNRLTGRAWGTPGAS